ncbi:MAG: glycosyltransferase family 2 protein [Pseudomonadota bacterium]|nr:glycosyltransferase family 2 protein [Pseudomonadota bacterium]
MNKHDVCGIVVTYHPDADFPTRLRRLASQVGAMVIVDNGSADTAVRMLHDIARNDALSLVLNSENLGIARALNIGIERATQLGYRWVLLLDQDSHVHDDLVATLVDVQNSHPDRERLAVIGSGYREVRAAHRPRNIEEAVGNQWDPVDWVITSGSLLSLAIYSVVGPFREEFFIDYVDLEYCIRARANGYSVINVRRPLISHVIGAPTQHKLLWTTRWTTNHPADRRYYRARNDTVMLREYGNYRYWRIKSCMRSFRTCKRIVLYERGKADKVIAVVQGWWDGIHGIMGPRNKVPGREHSAAKNAPAGAKSG